MKKKLLAMYLAIGLLLTACGNNAQQNAGAPTQTIEQTQSVGTETEPTTRPASSPENDTDIGLKNIKIDNTEAGLTDGQKLVLEYFDDDYLNVPSYEFLRRYPTVFDGAQLTLWGTVVKVLSMDENTIQMVLWLDVGPVEYTYAWEYPEYEGNYILLTCSTGDVAYMEGDTLLVNGRYTGIETVEFDGTSYTIPAVNVYNAFFDTSPAPSDIARYIEKFDQPFIRRVAKVIFGNDIEIRRPIIGTDITDIQAEMWLGSLDNWPCYVVELEKQSNAKFAKFFFYTGTSSDIYGGHRIADAKDAMGESPIERSIEFAADFEHFFLFAYDWELETLTLEYYDSSLNKIWEREFNETTSAHYDYTKNNIYLAANSELYIINIQTGEDTYPPLYVGEKMEIRKLRDGILMVSKSKSDGVMKVGLDGQMIWKSNLSDDTHSVDGVQIVNENIIISQYCWNSPEDFGTHYLVIDNVTGDVLQDAVSIS